MPPPITRTPPAFRLASPETGTTYPIYLSVPDARRHTGPWPTLLLTDGDYFFDPAVAAAQELIAAGVIAPLVLVGLGYGAGFGSAANHRGRDYTPTASSLEPASGGADAFLAFLSHSLWPELSRRYPLRDDARGLGGHSLGSLLVLHALFQPRPFFSRALASAPSIWWDDRSILRLADALRDRQDALPATLYLGVGTADTASMTGDLELLERQLTARPFAGLRVVSGRFPGRDHYDVVADSLRAGLRALFPRSSV